MRHLFLTLLVAQLVLIKPTYTFYTDIFNMMLGYYNLPSIEFPDHFEEEMVKAAKVLKSFPTVSTCT